MSDDHLDRQLAEMTDNPQVARAIKDSLRKLSKGAAGPELAEMATEVLNGRTDLRGLAKTSVYGSPLAEGVDRFRQWEAEASPEERRRVAEQTRMALEPDDGGPL